ncbi:hypothetical protein CEP54_007241 [Fusarium duplospermum]|uniref:Uncharacterized protein n=1 Tax=Fusarium duplospermum TaxID=1325734 RepID=A0A428Q2L4_9HYPO|nr:hypothetical protein CEP54_007241 [Fusarium duplospermum]
MDSEFPLFPLFPQEIQALIWDAAIRPIPGRRGVQRFVISDYDIERACSRDSHISKPLNINRYGRLVGGLSISVPLDDPYGGPNDSVYNLDSGLWTACTASRAAMERRFSKNEWWVVPERTEGSDRSTAPGRYFGEDNVSHSTFYIDNTGHMRYITFDYGQDVIFLDPRDMGLVQWFFIYIRDFLAQDCTPLIDFPSDDDAGRRASFIGDDIAVEYDPRMMDEVHGIQTHYCRKDPGIMSISLYDMVDVFHDRANRRLWFVDYRLQPLSAASTRIQGRERFYTSNAVLIEVQPNDLNSSWITSTENVGPDANKETVFEFFHHLGIGRLHTHFSGRLRALAYYPLSKEAERPLVQLQRAQDPSCPTCFPKEEPVRHTRPRPCADKEDDSLDDMSLSDLKLVE